MGECRQYPIHRTPKPHVALKDNAIYHDTENGWVQAIPHSPYLQTTCSTNVITPSITTLRTGGCRHYPIVPQNTCNTNVTTLCTMTLRTGGCGQYPTVPQNTCSTNLTTPSTTTLRTGGYIDEQIIWINDATNSKR